MTTKAFLQSVEEHLQDKIISQSVELGLHDITRNDLEVIQVWYCKTIQNHKGLFIIRNSFEDFIYPYFVEATYNGDAQEMYLDYYKKEFKEYC